VNIWENDQHVDNIVKRESTSTYLELVLVTNYLSRPIEYRHRVFSQPEILFELGEHEKYRFTKLWGAFFESLLKQITGTLDF
jgi:hypothetical protein